MTRAWRWLVPLAAVPVLGLLAYGFTLNPRDVPSPLVGRPAAPFALTSYDGADVELRDLRGKVVVVNFWSTSCVTCVEEMPKMVRTYNKYRDRGLETVAVAMSYDPPNYVLAYAEKNRLPFKVALDATGSAAKSFGNIEATPTTFVIDRRGKIVARYLGEPDFAKLHALLESKLDEPA